jgi:hypothetical protein
VVVTASTTVPTDSTTSVGTTSAALPIGRGDPLAGVSQDGMDTSQITPSQARAGAIAELFAALDRLLRS